MSALILLIVGLLCASPAITAATLHGDSSPTAYEVLESYGFPVGLLPKGVTSYEIDPSTGKFEVHLDETCIFKIQRFDVQYRTKVTGFISNKQIFGLKGVVVKKYVLWMQLDQVVINGDDLTFSVGALSAVFPVDNFEMIPQCGCGFECVNGEKRGKFSFKRLLPILEA